MFGSLFGKKGPQLRPMTPEDVAQTLHIIAEHDDDDAEEAAERFERSLEGLFVLTEGPRVVGVTGAAQDPETPDVFWLSWTYLADDKKGLGLGQTMIDQLGEMLTGAGCRKVFISTSDYVDEDGDDIYDEARQFYEQAMGARLEATIPDYFEPGEAQLIYGATLGGAQDHAEDDHPHEDDAEEVDAEEGREAAEARGEDSLGPLFFERLAPAPETDDGLAIVWRALEPGAAAPSDDLGPLLIEARAAGARFIMLSAPSDLMGPATPRLEAAGFQEVGRLNDYDRAGVDRALWRLTL